MLSFSGEVKLFWEVSTKLRLAALGYNNNPSGQGPLQKAHDFVPVKSKFAVSAINVFNGGVSFLIILAAFLSEGCCMVVRTLMSLVSAARRFANNSLRMMSFVSRACFQLHATFEDVAGP